MKFSTADAKAFQAILRDSAVLNTQSPGTAIKVDFTRKDPSTNALGIGLLVDSDKPFCIGLESDFGAATQGTTISITGYGTFTIRGIHPDGDGFVTVILNAGG